MSAFTDGMEAKDSTLRMAEDSDEPDIRRIQRAANRMLDTHRKETLELETRKLYYDRILSVMTHEMRNSVTPIISIASDMEKNPSKYEGERMKDAAEVIFEQGVGIKRFLDSYFELTHLPEPKLKELSLTGFLKHVSSLTDQELESRHLDKSVITYQTVEDQTFQGDLGMLSQVMLNLTRNALDSGGKDVKVDILATMSEEGLTITVSDNGCGIPHELKENLFQPFFTTKPDGVGVGLFLSRQIARKHGGELSCLNRPSSGGAAFRLTIPI